MGFIEHLTQQAYSFPADTQISSELTWLIGEISAYNWNWTEIVPVGEKSYGR
jgi:hypothetical protein